MESDTTTDNVKVRVAILKKARYYIENGNYCFICNAVLEAGEVLGAEKEADVLVAWISTMLAPCTTYLNWLRANHPHRIDTLEKAKKAKAKKAKEGRLAWLDWMIQEVQS